MDWIKFGMGREWGNCVLKADCFGGIGQSVGREGIGELCVESRLFWVGCIKGGRGREWGKFVLRADCVGGIG